MLTFTLQGHEFIIHPLRALFWKQQSLLLIADLHLGKADTFRHHGIGVPQTVQNRDLLRLQQALDAFKPKRLMVLGDLVHGRILGAESAHAWNDLVHRNRETKFELVLGNHDKNLHAGVLELQEIHDTNYLDGVYFTHEPLETSQFNGSAQLNIHGHLHAAVRVDGSHKKIPALAYLPPYVSLPAFSEFTAGALVSPRSHHVWAIDPDAAWVAQLR